MDPIARRLASASTDPRSRIATTSDLIAEGLTRAQLRRLLREEWVQLHRGVVALGRAAADDLACRAQAALVSVGPTATVSHETAALLSGIPGADGLVGVWNPGSQIHITVPGETFVKPRPGITLHRSDLVRGQQQTRGGIRMTSPIRTLADLLVTLPTEPAVVMVEGALHVRMLTRSELPALEGLVKGRRGSVQASLSLSRVLPGSESPLETLSRLRLIDNGLTPSAIQVDVRDRTGAFVGRADFLFERGGRRVYGESDGVTTHNGRQMRSDDALREEGFRFTGAQVVRWDWSDMLDGMADVAARINRFLDQP